MIDLHTHCLFSDGELLPSELVRRAEAAGYRAIAITDHGDASNVDFIIPRLVRVSRELSALGRIRVIPGIELTHVPPGQIAALVREAREMGAKIVVVHGETIVEPVMPGTNLAAIEAGADILAHPGLISEDEASLAAERGVALEITTRKGHSLTNGHVAKMARKTGAALVLNTDAHSPGDLVPKALAARIAAGAGMTEEEIRRMFSQSESMAERLYNHEAAG